ncbi:hypothetical protein F4781DRAFT_155111 [Annulohypoxylon bovei var. microspora]|nr:hypothetical protein F4781DRAFT_155111 [Annulohypoxylon bovei var. microspora]
MRAAQASRAAARAKALNLSVDTSVNANSSGSVATTKGADTPTQILTAPPTQQEFDITKVKTKPSKPNQALANPNWRNRELGPGAPLVPPSTAGLPKTEFQKSGGHVVKKPDRDVSPDDGYVVRRIRTAPVDPDFIHSAPLTKKDYRGAEDDSDDSEHGENKEVRPVDPQTSTGLGPNFGASGGALVRLEPLSPSTRESFGAKLNLERKKEDGQWVEKWRYGNFPLGAIPLSIANSPSREESVAFPTAEVKAIRESRRFKSGTWEDLYAEVRKKVAKLAEPRTAGLPSIHLRQEYEYGLHDLAIGSIIQDPAAQRVAVSGRRYEPPPHVPGHPQEEAERYDSLIHKLNKPSEFSFSEAHAEQSRAILQRRHNIESNENSTESKFLAMGYPPAPGVGSMGTKNAEKKCKSLNPRASEFQFSGQTNTGFSSPSDATYHNLPSPLGNGPSINQAPVNDGVQAILNMVSCLRAEVAELKASSLHPSQSQDVGLQHQIEHLQGMANRANADPGSQVPALTVQGQAGLLPAPGAWQGAQLRAPHYGGYIQPQLQMEPQSSMVQSQRYIPGMYDSPVVSGSALAAPAAPAASAYNGISYNGMGYNGTSYNGTNYSGTSYSGPSYNEQGYSAAGFNVPTLSMPSAHTFGGQPNTSFQMAPDVNTFALAGPVSSGNIPLHQQAQMAFGPKPVRKPRGPPRMNDPHFVQHQQDYELYLEMKRAADPSYARQCRDRQARRAERQQSSQRS